MNKDYFLQMLPAGFFGIFVLFFIFPQAEFTAYICVWKVFEKQIKKVSGGLEELNSPKAWIACTVYLRCSSQ